jgi:hypothetical protein
MQQRSRNFKTVTGRQQSDQSRDLLPLIDDTYDIGAVDQRWRNLYVSNLIRNNGDLSTFNLSVTEDASIGDRLNVGGDTSIGGLLTVQSLELTGGQFTVGNNQDNNIKDDSNIENIVAPRIQGVGSLTTPYINIMGEAISDKLRVTRQTDATSSTDTNAALHVEGGLSVVKSVKAASVDITGKMTIQDTTNATSSTDTNASISTQGGVAIAKDCQIGGKLVVENTISGDQSVQVSNSASDGFSATRFVNSNSDELVVGVSGPDTSTEGNGYLTTTNALIIGSGSQERARVSSNGNLGIGTSTPSQRLHVVGNTLCTGSVTADSFSGTLNASNLAGTVTRPLDTSGRVRQLGGRIEIRNNTLNENAGSIIDLGIDTRAVTQADYRIKQQIGVFGNGSFGRGNMYFALNQQNNNTNVDLVQDSKLTILTSNGNVGIGVNDPSQKLHVDGNLRLNGDTVSIDQVTLKAQESVSLYQVDNISVDNTSYDRLGRLMRNESDKATYFVDIDNVNDLIKFYKLENNINTNLTSYQLINPSGGSVTGILIDTAYNPPDEKVYHAILQLNQSNANQPSTTFLFDQTGLLVKSGFVPAGFDNGKLAFSPQYLYYLANQGLDFALYRTPDFGDTWELLETGTNGNVLDLSYVDIFDGRLYLTLAGTFVNGVQQPTRVFEFVDFGSTFTYTDVSALLPSQNGQEFVAMNGILTNGAQFTTNGTTWQSTGLTYTSSTSGTIIAVPDIGRFVMVDSDGFHYTSADMVTISPSLGRYTDPIQGFYSISADTQNDLLYSARYTSTFLHRFIGSNNRKETFVDSDLVFKLDDNTLQSTRGIVNQLNVQQNNFFVNPLNGRVGIRETNPTTDVHMNGRLRVQNGVHRIELATPQGDTGLIFNGDQQDERSRFDMRNLKSSTTNNRTFQIGFQGEQGISIRKGSGNVGIGVSSSNEKLQVQGNIRVSGRLSLNNQSFFRNGQIATTTNPGIPEFFIPRRDEPGSDRSAFSIIQTASNVISPNPSTVVLCRNRHLIFTTQNTTINQKLSNSPHLCIAPGFLGHRVGIHTSSPTQILDVNGNIRSRQDIYANGNVGIGTTNPTTKLHVNGNILATGSITGDNDVNKLGLINTWGNGAVHINLPAQRSRTDHQQRLTVAGTVEILKDPASGSDSFFLTVESNNDMTLSSATTRNDGKNFLRFRKSDSRVEFVKSDGNTATLQSLEERVTALENLF